MSATGFHDRRALGGGRPFVDLRLVAWRCLEVEDGFVEDGFI
jgi:hypothetical protein